MAAKSTNDEGNSAAIDRISGLPQSVLCHILSFLPTQKAVSTSILSNSWRELWTLVLDINLDDDYDFRLRSYDDYDSDLTSEHGKPRAEFSDIVDSILAQRKALSVRKFRLRIRHQRCEPSQFNEWISAAVAGNVEEMDFSVDLKETIDLLPCIFTCKSIVVLKLFGKITLPTPSNVHLPKLKTLELTIHVDGPSLNWFLSGCPVLEDFTVGISVESPIKICVPSLKRLCIDFEDGVNELQLNTPTLECLRITGIELPHYLGGNLHSLVNANISIRGEGTEFDYFHQFFIGPPVHIEEGEPNYDFVIKLIRGIHQVKFLHLALQSPCDIPHQDLPEFSNLVCLEFGLAGFGWNFLVNLLQNCHKLEVLVVHKKNWNFDEPKWTNPTSVPNCVASTLTVVEYTMYAGWENELSFIAYLLENANFLKKVRIGTAYGMNSRRKRHVFKRLSRLQKRSDACELVLY